MKRTRAKSSTVTPVQLSEILSNSAVVKGVNPIPPQVEGIGNGLPKVTHGQVAIRGVEGTISLRRREWNMKWIRVFSAVFALAGMMAGVTLFHDDPPEADVVVAYDLPTPRRLRVWAATGSRVLLVPPIAAHYVEALGVEDRPLRLPGALEAARDDAAARRGAGRPTSRTPTPCSAGAAP